MPPFQRKTLVLIGAQGVGRRSLKNRLIVMNPLRYGTTVPCEQTGQMANIIAMSAACAHTSPPISLSSHVAQTEGRGAGRPELPLRDTGGDGEGHQGEPLPGAWRIRRKPLWHQDRLYPRGGGCRTHLHPGCQPSGWLKEQTLAVVVFYLVCLFGF